MNTAAVSIVRRSPYVVPVHRRRPIMSKSRHVWMVVVLMFVAMLNARAQSFRVQCPTSTITHPLTGTNCRTSPTGPGCNNAEPSYNGPTHFTRPATGASQWVVPTAGTVNGAIKCQQISGGDGYSTMADGTQTFMFSFGPLSGLADIANGQPGTQFPTVFNPPGRGGPLPPLQPGDPATTNGASSIPYSVGNPTFNGNGAV